MNSTLKSLIKLFLPASFQDLYHSSRFKVNREGGFYGKYASWEAALQRAEGYDAELILNQVASVAEKVKDDPNCFERDGVIIREKDYSYPVLAHLAKWKIEKGALSVLDLGGSLGSLYFQFKKMFPSENLSWMIVEQPHYVAKGHSLFNLKDLDFNDSMEGALEKIKPDVAIFSAALQYFRSPDEWLDKISQQDIAYLVIDRLPVCQKSENKITIQYVPKHIYPASYPAWIFSYQKMLEKLSKHYTLIHDYAALDGMTYCGLNKVQFRGFILARNQTLNPA